MKKPALLFIALLTVWTARSQATVKEYGKVFKTYAFSDPDPIAKPGAPIYPYFRFDGYTDQPVNKEWKVVELENEFIKVMILPEIGGKIWAAWEKSTGLPFLYYNQVVKFRDVAMRGPWTSGGLEANYGIIGHTPNCATPVDFLAGKKPDGSVSCWIGTLDLLTQTYWTIEINLPRDKAYFTTRSFWHNATPLEQPYYTWMNAGIKAAGNLEFIYPGNRYLGHGGEYADWKINRDNGRDISFYDRNDFGGYKSYHVFGQYTDFFGAYWHQQDFGMGRYSLRDEKAGKKIWIWGLSRQGMIWDKLLSDTDGQYVEVQSGRLFNQSAESSSFTPFKHLGFAPATSDSWTEYWFPVKKTKGFVYADPLGALNVRSSNGYLKLDFSPLQEVNESLTVMNEGKTLYQKIVNVKPMQPFSDSIAFQGDAGHVVISMGSKMKYEADPKESQLQRPLDSPANFDWNTLQGLYLQGKENIRQRYYPQAEQKLIAALGMDPNYLPALGDMSMLMFRKSEYRQSLDYARQALRVDTYDPAGNFYYGMSNMKLGNAADAKDGFDIATLSGAYRGAAYLALSKIYFTENNFAKAEHYADKSLGVNSENVEAWQLLALIGRITKDRPKAKASLEKLTGLNPLNHFIRFEAYRESVSDTARNRFTSLIRNELPQETYLQLADWYLSLGLAGESVEVLQCAPPSVEIYYWIAYLKNKLHEGEEKEWIEKANALSPAFVFPFRSTSSDVLKWVISQTTAWRPIYYLALLEWSRNNTDRARELIGQCGDPDFAPFYATRAALFNNDAYTADVSKAVQLQPHEWRYGKLLVQRFIEKRNYTEALATAKKYHALFPEDFRLTMLLADALLLNKQYTAATELLGHTKILPYEGATDGRRLYFEAWMMRAVEEIKASNFKKALASVAAARQWPESLGSGKPYDEDIDDRLEDYLEGLCLKATNQNDLAMKKWKEIISFKPTGRTANTFITALALRQTGRAEQGEKMLLDWATAEPKSTLAQWSMEVFHEINPSVETPKDVNARVVGALLLTPPSKH